MAVSSELLQAKVQNVGDTADQLHEDMGIMRDKVEDIDKRVIRLEVKHDSLHEKIDNLLTQVGWFIKVVVGVILTSVIGAFFTWVFSNGFG